MKSKNRVMWIDLCKGFGIILVVMGHLNQEMIPHLNSLCNVIYTFHMPFFFLISGLVFNYKMEFKNFLWKKFKALLIPFYIFTAVFFLKTFISEFNCFIINNNSTSLQLKQLLVDKFIYGNGLWFLPCLFMVNIICYFLMNYFKRGITIVILILSAFVSFYLTKNGINNSPMQVISSLYYAIYFAIGIFLGKKDNKFLNLKNSSIILFVLSWFTLDVINYFLYGKVRSFDSSVIYIVAPLFASVAFVNVIKKSEGTLKRVEKQIVILGQNSLVIYLVHGYLLNLISGCLYRQFCKLTNISLFAEVLMAIISILLTIFLSVLISLLINRKFSWMIGKW